MSTIVTRAGKGSPLTHNEVDANFNNLNNDKYQSGDSPSFVTLGATTGNITTVNATTVDSTNLEVTNLKAKDGTSAGTIADSTGVVTLASSVLTTTDINGGTIDGTTIGGSTAAAGTFTSGTITTGNLAFTATGQRITGDFSNATIANRLAFQTNVTNTNTTVHAIPNGTGNVATISLEDSSSPGNNSVGQISIVGTSDYRINSSIRGTGTYLPMTFYTGGSERLRLDTSGNLGIGTSSPSQRLTIADTGSGLNRDFAIRNGDATNFHQIAFGYNAGTASSGVPQYSTFILAEKGGGYGDVGGLSLGTIGPAPNIFIANGAERMRIDSVGRVGIATNNPNVNLTVSATSGESFRLINSTGSERLHFYTRNAAGTSRIESQNSDLQLFAFDSNALTLGTANTTRITIDSSGNVGIGGTATAFTKTEIAGTLPTSGNVSVAFRNLGTVPSGTTTAAYGFNSHLLTQAASFTCSNFYHFFSFQNSIGATSAVTNQYGYFADSSLTGATNNYGFYSNIASGSNRWNFYAAGTANNYFAGRVAIGTTTLNVGFEVASTASEDNRSLRVAYDTTYYFEIRNLGASGARLRSNNGQIIFNITGTDYAELKTSGEFVTGGTTDNGAYNLQCNGTGVWGAGAYVNGSDARLKDNIQSLDAGLDVVKAMRPVTFQYKPEYSKDQNIQPGFIAQELQEAMAGKPYLEGVVQEGTNHLNVAYQNIIPILVKAIQELEAKVAALEAK